MGQTWVLIVISIPLVIGATIMFSSLDCTRCFGFAREAFHSTIFLIIKAHPSNDANLNTHNNLHSFFMGTTIRFSTVGYTILMIWICKKSFFSTIFFRIKVYPSNETNLGTYNNLYSFCYWHYKHVLYIEIQDIDALDLQEKLFFLPFSL